MKEEFEQSYINDDIPAFIFAASLALAFICVALLAILVIPDLQDCFSSVEQGLLAANSSFYFATAFLAYLGLRRSEKKKSIRASYIAGGMLIVGLAFTTVTSSLIVFGTLST